MAFDLDSFLQGLLVELQQRLDLVILRPVSFPLIDGADIDALVDPARRDELVRVVAGRAFAAGVSVTIDRSHAPKQWIAFHDPVRDRDLILEAWSHVEVRDPAGKSARVISWQSLAPHLADPSVLPLIYLGHLATKRKALERGSVQERLRHWRGAPEAGPLIEGLLSGTLTVNASASAANARLRERGILLSASVADTWAHRRRARVRHRRRARIRTRIVAVTGPDGAGKSTVIEHLRRDTQRPSKVVRFKNLFRHHPLYKILRWRHGVPKGLEKNKWDELHGPELFTLARAGWPLLRLRALIPCVQWCDRFWHDMLFEGMRVRTNEPRLTPGWQTLATRMPVPGWHLHCDATDDVLLARKDELPRAALSVYRAGILEIDILRDVPLLTLLYTGSSLDETLVCARRAARAAGLR